MKRALRFFIHEMTPLRPISNGMYIGDNPFNNKKDDLIVDEYHEYIIIKSDCFAGRFYEFMKRYKKEYVELADRKLIGVAAEQREIVQKKLELINTTVNKICSGIGNKNLKGHITYKFQFIVSKNHSCYNPDDDNIAYEEELDSSEFPTRITSQGFSTIPNYLQSCSSEDILNMDTICVETILITDLIYNL